MKPGRKTINELYPKAAKLALKLRSEGLPYAAIAARLFEKGFMQNTGLPFSKPALMAVILREALAGSLRNAV